jgi:ketosteroid isomerase-like protein
MPRSARSVAAALLVLSAACRPAPRSETSSMGATAGVESAGLSAQDKAGLKDLSDKWAQAVTAGDANTLNSLYTSDATLLPYNEPAVTGSGIKSYWNGLTKNFSGRAELNNTAVDGRGDLAYVAGTFRFTPKSGGKVTEGKWVTVNKKQSDGSWKIAVDIWNLNAPEK